MRTNVLFSGVALLAGMTCFAATDDKQSDPKPDAKSNTEVFEVPTGRPEDSKHSEDEDAIRESAVLFAKAYEAGDAKEVCALFTTEAEYVDEAGNVIDGREDIEASLVKFFAEHPNCRLEMNTETIRFIGPGVAVEDGNTHMICAEASISVDSRYTTLHVKTNGKWLAASVRNHAPQDRREHQAHVQQLNWLIGDWVDEGDDAVVHFGCESADNGNFLVRSFTIHVAGQDAMTGTQRIGWDPLTGKLRTWIFDSEGSFGEGFWSRRIDDEVETWILKTSGVMADGQTASSTSIYTFINDNTMTWQSVDHEIGGAQQPDSEIVTIVRSAPVPVQTVADDSQ